MAPEVEFVAGDEAVELDLDRLPVPKPSFTHGEENSGDTKAPYKEVGSDRTTWMDGATVSVVDGCKYEKKIIQEGDEKLFIRRVSISVLYYFCKTPSRCRRMRGQSEIHSAYRCDWKSIDPIIAPIIVL